MIIDLIPKGTKRRSGKPLARVAFLVAHDTGNINSTARNNVDYFKRSADQMSASAHIFVDDKETICCVPTNEKAWHVMYNKPKDNELFGDDANDIALGIELCYFDDPARSLRAYERYVDEMAVLCTTYNLDPKKSIVGHYLLDPERKTDPVNAFKRIGVTMEEFLSDVASKITTPAKGRGQAAVTELAKRGRLSNPEMWYAKVTEVPDLEWVFIKWLEDIK